MYEQLGDGSYANTRQLAGYVTLFSSWIYEHFPSIGHRQLRDAYVEDEPRCMKYVVGSRLSTLASVRMQLDSLCVGAVQWMPYEEHRAVRPFEWISLFSGYIRLRGCRQMHLPERVLRQFGYIQCIPSHPTTVHHGDPSTSDIDHRWLDYNANLVQGVVLAADVGTCVPAYLEWFRSISHPYIIQMAEDDRPPVITHYGRRQGGNDTISEHPAVGLCRRIASTLQLIAINCRRITFCTTIN
ncbi:protein MAIN-LIKE 1-like [Phaseolus vulgaris]|uniref:protein MAIN-LIKE 1-like n=1 Tax=Phaseolus vulgaris TaxID=3885 RepID=UPI0035CA47D4